MFGDAASSSFYRQSYDAAPLRLEAERRRSIATRAEGRRGVPLNQHHSRAICVVKALVTLPFLRVGRKRSQPSVLPDS
jgi:hypothetical protein